jgi:hypothetical protein
VLGNPGTWDNSPLGRFEIMINSEDGYSYCPFVHFDLNLTLQFQQQVSQLMADIEDYKNDSEIYNQDSQPYPGCNIERMRTN